MNSTYEFTLKAGPKVKMENFIGTKSWRKILEGLKRKVGIFIRTKNMFNPKIKHTLSRSWNKSLNHESSSKSIINKLTT